MAYPRAKDAGQVAKAGVEAGAEFDTGTSLPLTVHTVTLGE